MLVTKDRLRSAKKWIEVDFYEFGCVILRAKYKLKRGRVERSLYIMSIKGQGSLYCWTRIPYFLDYQSAHDLAKEIINEAKEYLKEYLKEEE